MKTKEEQFDYTQTYYKVINKKMKHNSLRYCDENKNIILDTVINDCLPFEKEGSCVKGGIYFTDKYHIFEYVGYGIYIAEIIIPEDALVVKDNNKWRANKIIIKSLTNISDFTFDDESWIDYNYTNNVLIDIIKFSTEKYKELAWNKLLKQNPSNSDLCDIIIYSTEKFKELASDKLLKQNPDKWDLCNIIKYSTEKYKELAWDKLLKQNPSNFYLCDIIRYSTEKYKELASDKILTNNPTNMYLVAIIGFSTEKYKELASDLLLSRKPSNKELCYIIKNSTEKYKKLAQDMLNNNKS